MKNKTFVTSIFFILYSLIGFSQTIDSNYFDLEHALKHIRAITNDSSKIDSLLRVARAENEAHNIIVPPVLNTFGNNQRPGDHGVFSCDSDNWDFNNGTTSGWTTTGNVYMQNSGSDPYGGYPWVYPGGGSHSVKISGDQNSQKNGSISRAISVPAVGTTYFTFHFAMSIFNYPHPASQAAKFRVEFFDASNNLIPCPNFVCYYSSDQGAQGANNFQSTPNSASTYNPSANGDSPGSYGVTYTPWNDVTLDLSGYAGQTITARFRVDWCGPGPDWCYALLDVDCPTNNNEPFEICTDLTNPYNLCAEPNMASYEWKDINDNVIGNQECIDITQAGTYFCDVLPANVSCSAGSIITYEYVILEQPKVDFDLLSDCFKTDLTIDNNSICPSQTSCTYTWDFGNGETASGFEPSYTYPFNGVYDVQLSVETDQGCIAEMTKNIDINYPIADFSLNDACQDVSIAMTDLSVPYGTSVLDTWEWSFGDGTSSTVTSPQHTYTTPGTKTVTLIVVSDDNCSDTISKDVEIFDLPVTNFIANDTCFGDLTTFTNNTTIANGNITDWAWDFGDGNTITTETATHTYAANGSYTVSLTATSNNNCITTVTKPVLVFSEPTANYSFVDDCLYEEVNFIDNSTINSGVISTWQWDLGDGNASSVSNPNYTYSAEGTYTTTLIITSDNGCDDTLSQQIIRYPIPNVNFSSAPECLYTPLTFTNNSTINAPGNITSWIWNFGDGSALISDENPTHIFPSEGEYDITLIANSNNGCVATFNKSETVYPVPTAAFASTTICENTPPTQFTNLSTISTGSIVNYDWNFGTSSSNLPNPNNSFPQFGVYNTEFTVTSNFGCTNTIVNPVTVLEKPSVDFVSDVLEGCNPVCVNLTDLTTTSTSSTVSWLWSFGNGLTSNSQNPSTCFTNSSNENDLTFSIELTTKNNLGCSNTSLKSDYITVYHNPVSLFETLPPETDMYIPTIDFVNTSIGADEYEWDLGDGTSSYLFELDHNYQDTGKYFVTLIANTINNCSDTIELPIRINPVTNIYVPNTFTPNGDGNNDVFNIVGYNLKAAEISIFDKWGTLIYYTDDINRGWDGDYKGQPAKTDTYIWKFTISDGFGETHEYKGHVLLMR